MKLSKTIEFPAVGALPTVALLTQVVGELFVFIKDQLVGGNVAVVKPSEIGSEIPVPSKTFIIFVCVSTSLPKAFVAVNVAV